MMRTVRLLLLVAALVAPGLVYAGPRSGASFGGFRGFRSGAGSLSRSFSGSRGFSGGRRYGGGSSFVFLPSFGWGYGGWGFGGSTIGSLMLVAIVGLGAVMVVHSIRRAARRGLPSGSDSYDVAASAGRCYVYKVQLGLGRSGRGVQQRLEEFASTGDTGSEAGLAELLRQTALELMRERDSIRYSLIEASGPFSLTNGEIKMTGAATAERSRFQVERTRGANGHVRRSEAAPTVGKEVLEYLVVTVLVATRAPLGIGKGEDRQAVDTALTELGSVPASTLLGLEVIWTPADPEDSLTATDLLTTYPEMRSL
jgi:uncharacterized membrane protein